MDEKVEKVPTLQDDAVAIISEVFGESTAKLFVQSTVNKPDKEILLLLKEILVDLLGERKAVETIEQLSQKYTIYE